MSDTRYRNQARLSVFFAYVACIIAANLALDEWGMIVVFGTMLPAGVFFAGATFTIRDVLDDLGGRPWIVAAILSGGAASMLFAPSFAVASSIAFLTSETADWAIYSPLKRRNRWVAIAASNTVGSAIDSVIFLHLAFGSVDGWLSLTIAKALITLPFVVVMMAARRRR